MKITKKAAKRARLAKLVRMVLMTPERGNKTDEEWAAAYAKYRTLLNEQTKARLQVATELFARKGLLFDNLTETEWLAVRHIDLELLARLGATIRAEPILEPGSYPRSQFVATHKDLSWTTYFWSNHPAALCGYPELSKRFNNPAC